jgi:hypothetical protein
MEVVLEDNGLKECIDKDVPKPDVADVANIDAWQKKVEKERRILLEGVRDHIVSNLHGKATPYAMWKTLMDLFQNSSDHRKLALKDKLRKIKMEKGDSIQKYLTKFVLCQDELGSVGITVVDDDLVSLDLLGLPKIGTIIKTLSMEGKIFQIGNDYGRIWCRRSSGGTPEMALHQRMMMKRIVLWLPRQGKGRGRNSIQNPSLKARSWICPK